MGKIKNYIKYPIFGFSFALAGLASAQDSGGLNASLSVSQTLRYTDSNGFTNPGNGSLRSLTNLGFSLSGETRRDSFSLGVNSGLVFSESNSADSGIIDPTLSFGYQRSSKRSELNAALSYRSVELDSFLSDTDPDASLTVLDGGSRTDLSGSLGLVFGKDMPVGGSITLSHSSNDYSADADPELIDTVATSVNAQVNLKFDDRITGRVTAGWSEVDQEDDSNRQTRSIGVGAELAVNKNLAVGADLTYSEVETLSSGVTNTQDGLGLTLTATQSLPNGTLSGRLSTGINQNGRNSSFSVSRDAALRNGSVGITLGGNTSDASGFAPVYGLRYSSEIIPGGTLSANLTQAFNVSNDGTEAINTNLSVNFATPLTRVSNISTGFSFRDSNVLNVSGEDANRFDVSVQYRHSLARDWGLIGGVTHSFATEDGESDRSSNTVFVGLDKTFSWRP